MTTPNDTDQTPASGPPLREMQFSDILDTTFSLYRNNFRLYIGISATMYIPFGILKILLTSDSKESFILPEILVVDPIVSGALVFAVSHEYLSRTITVGEAFRHGKTVSILGANLVVWILIPLMIFTVIGIPFGIYFAIAWSLCRQTIVVEGTPALAAFRRSRELVRQMWWRVFGIQIVFVLLIFVITLTPLFTLEIFIEDLEIAASLQHIINTILNIVISPIVSIGWTLLYYDLRIRKEAFDIEMMATNLNSELPRP